MPITSHGQIYVKNKNIKKERKIVLCQNTRNLNYIFDLLMLPTNVNRVSYYQFGLITSNITYYQKPFLIKLWPQLTCLLISLYY